jgi:hypothetical protein
MDLAGYGKKLLFLIFLFFSLPLYSQIVQRTLVQIGEGNTRAEAIRNAFYNVLMKCAEEMGSTSIGLEEFMKKFPSPGDYVLGYKIISSRYENKKVFLEVMVDVDLKSLKEIFIKEGIIKSKGIFPKVSMDVIVENKCQNVSFENLKNFLERFSKTEFPDYFDDKAQPDYQITISVNGEKREIEEISWCLISLKMEIKGENGMILSKDVTTPVYRFSSEVYPEEVSDFVKRLFVQAMGTVEKDWEERGNVTRIVIRINGWLPVKERESLKRLLIQNFPFLHSINLLSESSQYIEFMCIYAGPSEGIVEKLISTLNSNGWNARKITEEVIEVKK